MSKRNSTYCTFTFTPCVGKVPVIAITQGQFEATRCYSNWKTRKHNTPCMVAGLPDIDIVFTIIPCVGKNDVEQWLWNSSAAISRPPDRDYCSRKSLGGHTQSQNHQYHSSTSQWRGSMMMKMWEGKEASAFFPLGGKWGITHAGHTRSAKYLFV